MGALLNMVSDSSVRCPAEPKVLTQQACEQLATLTSAERAIRAMGYSIEHSMLTAKRPQIQIKRVPGKSLVPLLDRMGPRSFRQASDHTLVSGQFEGVDVMWLEARA